MADAIQKAAHEALAVAMPDLAEALASSLRDAMGHAFVCGYRAGCEAAAEDQPASRAKRPSKRPKTQAQPKSRIGRYRLTPPWVANIVREAWPRGASLEEINAMCRPHGWQFDDASHVGNFACRLGVRRSPEFLREMRLTAMAKARSALVGLYGSGLAGHETHNIMEGR